AAPTDSAFGTSGTGGADGSTGSITGPLQELPQQPGVPPAAQPQQRVPRAPASLVIAVLGPTTPTTAPLSAAVTSAQALGGRGGSLPPTSALLLGQAGSPAFGTVPATPVAAGLTSATRSGPFGAPDSGGGYVEPMPYLDDRDGEQVEVPPP